MQQNTLAAMWQALAVYLTIDTTFQKTTFFLLYCFLISASNAEAEVWAISHITDKV